MSDTHSFNERIGALAGEVFGPERFVPNGDVLIHAGDLTDTGRTEQILDAYKWLSRMPHDRIIVIPGNHDFGFERIPGLRSILDQKFPRITTLIDETTTLADLKVYGSPYQPWFHDWAYNFLPGPAGEQQAQEKWAGIPDDVDILITHGPPRGILDETLRAKHVGCPQLRERVSTLTSIKLHIFGHIHEGHGTHEDGRVLFVNACTCDHLYDPVQEPIVVDWDGAQMSVATGRTP